MKKHDDESGDWRGLGSDTQDPRYAAIADMISCFKNNAAVLDVGCGEALLRRWLPSQVSYFGVDPSSIAIQNVMDRDSTATVWKATGEEFDSQGKQYDCVVFNEMLYYTRRPVALIKKYSGFLESDGAVLCSIFQKPDKFTFKQLLRTVLTFRRPRSAIRCDKRIQVFMARNGWIILDDRRVPIPGTSLHWHIWLAKPRNSMVPS